VGLLMTPWPLSVALAAPLAAKMSHSISTAKLCFFGCIIFSLGLLCAGLWPLKDNPWSLIAFNIMAGAGFGFFQTPNNRNMLFSAPRDRAGAAGGMQATTRLLGQACGAVGMGLLFGILPLEEAPRIGLILAAGLALVGGLVSALRANSQ
jgi:DHA2 family multidrug resistance protein-like MFS transporter